MTPIRKTAVKWLALGLLAAACSTPIPAPVGPSAAPVTHVLRVIAAGTDGPVAGLRVCGGGSLRLDVAGNKSEAEKYVKESIL